MNYLQFFSFACYFAALFISGVGIYALLNGPKVHFNRITCVGESLLLGSISLVGQLLILSVFGLYRNPYLWGVVFLNYAFILNIGARRLILEFFKGRSKINISTIIFAILVGILIFRNLYFLVDVDSNSTYLFTQRLWLEHSSSLIGNLTHDLRIFVPQFDAVPYSLGISIFGQETIFPQLVGVLWRVIALLLVFGYTKYRLNGYYALAASAFIIFNDHFFYSGANQHVIINAAIIALMFAAAYNFWEARLKNDTSRFVLAVVFLTQLPANKYYLVLCSLFLFLFGLSIQTKPFRMLTKIFKVKKYLYFVITAFFLVSLWYIKNFIITGDPAFPLFAGKLHVFGWTQEQLKVFGQLLGSPSPFVIIKYISFLFIWPGVNCAKYILISILSLPFVVCISVIKERADKKEIVEICFWLGVCLISLLGLCFVIFEDPRYYRYLIGIFSFSAVLSLRFIIKVSLNTKKEIIPAIIILCLSLQGYSIVKNGQGIMINYPTVKENIDIALNKIHIDYIIRKHYPEVPTILKSLEANKDKFDSSAWIIGENSSAFLMPYRPMISSLYSTTIKWDSYSREDLVVNDLRQNGIKWVMRLENDNLVFMPIAKFASEAVKWNRSPKRRMFNYGFPEELVRIR